VYRVVVGIEGLRAITGYLAVSNFWEIAFKVSNIP